MRETLALEMPSSAAMCSWVRRSRRNLSTSSAVARAIWLGNEWGFEERSRKPSTPSARKRATHLPTLFRRRVVLSCRGGLGQPTIHYGANHRRPLGVRRAFLWMSIRSSANRYVWRHQLSRPGPNGQPPESSQLANFAPLDVSRARCRPNHRKIGQKPTVATRWRPNGAPLSLLARWVKSWFSFQMLTGAAEGIRTPDPRITNALLYQLSYRGTRPE